ncbi:MAG: NUDIX hydrolase [Patescibacteria group bacterium]|jgi:8-oxo-dGTP pyrophosphatase MutT (NUDIX family)
MRTINRDIVSVLLLSKEGKLLIGLQSLNEYNVYPGCWGIIGGGVDNGEDQRTALNREVLEESGVDIQKYHAELIDVAGGEAEKTLRNTNERVLVKMKFHVYRVVMDDKNSNDITVTLNDEHSAYQWLYSSELSQLKLAPPSEALFKKLGYLQ